jgi:hypothetical protein
MTFWPPCLLEIWKYRSKLVQLPNFQWISLIFGKKLPTFWIYIIYSYCIIMAIWFRRCDESSSYSQRHGNKVRNERRSLRFQLSDARISVETARPAACMSYHFDIRKRTTYRIFPKERPGVPIRFWHFRRFGAFWHFDTFGTLASQVYLGVVLPRYGNSRTSRTVHSRTKNFPYIPGRSRTNKSRRKTLWVSFLTNFLQRF